MGSASWGLTIKVDPQSEDEPERDPSLISMARNGESLRFGEWLPEGPHRNRYVVVVAKDGGNI